MIKTGDQFPVMSEVGRINNYNRRGMLLNNEHYQAFSITATEFSNEYQRLRYVAANFCGLVSKVCADMLFGEEVQLKAGPNTEWLEALWYENNMKTQMYESSLSNSARGDAVIRIRVEDGMIKLEDINPAIYFPELMGNSYRQQPKVERLMWTECVDNMQTGKQEEYLIVETHTYGSIDLKVFVKENSGRVGAMIPVDMYNAFSGMAYVEHVDTGLDNRNLLVHIPNYRTSNSYFGTSDYQDIEMLNFALNNRLTKVDNILDKHSDPILAVPPGILDENGQVKNGSLNMIEVSEPGAGKPEYIVWNANLDVAFKEIDKLLELMAMFSESAPDAIGMVNQNGGAAESGRALKFRLLRTIGKTNRKRLYYDHGITRLLETAQMLAIANGYLVNGMKITKVEDVELIWSDGVINDDTETLQNESIKLEQGLTSQKRSIMVVNGVDESEAEEILVEVNEEKEAKADLNPFFGNTSLNSTSDNANNTETDQKTDPISN